MAWYWIQATPPTIKPPKRAGIRVNLMTSLGSIRAKEALRMMTALW